MNRITGTVLILLSIIGLTYFAYYTEAYLSYFKNLKEPEVKVFEKSEVVKEVSFYGIEFRNTNIGSNSLLTTYNVFLKETKNMEKATFVYLDSESVKKENIDILLKNNYKLISCFDRNYGSCLFYNQPNNKTSIYDELALEFVLLKANRIPGTNTLKSNISKQNYITVLTDIGIEIPKELILGENTFYTENSVFKEKEKSKKEDKFLFGLFLHFLVIVFFIGSFSMMIEGFTDKKTRENEAGGIFIFFMLSCFLFFILMITNPFDFLIPLYN